MAFPVRNGIRWLLLVKGISRPWAPDFTANGTRRVTVAANFGEILNHLNALAPFDGRSIQQVVDPAAFVRLLLYGHNALGRQIRR